MAADQEEIKIPVFSVLKNGIVLKNIFLNNPQWESKLSSDLCSQEEEEEDPLLIGRHPDCHIVLDHPSISRFHLEIRMKPASNKLSVIDRSSVHGTWVSGIKIQPNSPIDLREGDMVKLGASTRVYKLHWVPLSCAFEMEKPLPALLEENEETHQLENLNEVWAAEIPSVPPIPECFSLPIGSDNQSSAGKELGEKSPSLCSVVPMLDSIGSSFPTEGENRTPEKNGNANEVKSERQQMSLLTSGKRGKPLSLLSRRSKSKSTLHVQTGRNRENMGGRSCIKELEVGNQDNDATLEECKREETLCRVLFENEKENEEEEETFVSAKENMSPLSSMSQTSHTGIREALLNASAILTMREELFHSEKETWTPEASTGGLKQNRPISTDCVEEEEEVHGSDKENLTPVVPSHHRLRKNLEELQISSLNVITAFSEEVDILYLDKEIWTPEVPRGLKSNPQHNGEEEKEAFPSDKENMTAKTSEIKKPKESLQRDQQRLKGEGEAFPSDKENLTPQVSGVKKSNKRLQRNLLRLDGGEEAFPSDKENLTPQVSGVKKSNKRLQRNLLRLDGGEERFPSDKENLTPQVSGANNSKKKIQRNFLRLDGEEDKSKKKVQRNFLRLDGEEEALASDKENITPNASGVKKSKRALTDSQARTEKEIMGRRKERVPFQFLFESSPSKNGSPLNHAQRMEDKERTPFKSLIEKSPSKNHSPLSDARKIESNEKVQSPLKSSPSKNNSPNHVQRTTDKERRATFQSLQSSPLRNRSPVSNAQRTVVDIGNKNSSFVRTQKAEDELSNSSSQSVDQVLHKAGGNKKKWNMVVDTGCFLNEESRKAVQLLEGLKGTQLIIPRIVIRELDCLKRRESLFRKKTKAASSVLQWIEECMVRSSWWIHVQNSLETMPVASTPPATPRSEFGDGPDDEMGAGASNPMAFSTYGSLMEIVSPTAEDHILDCALLFKRIKDDGQLVLLTDSVTLKIKAMAEGLLCETPTEFRKSLVNPYSKRFLWSDSSPRGSTWSCLDEEGLADNYYHQFRDVRKTANATESIRGLKLILLHNSHYGKTSLVN